MPTALFQATDGNGGTPSRVLFSADVPIGARRCWFMVGQLGWDPILASALGEHVGMLTQRFERSASGHFYEVRHEVITVELAASGGI